MLVDIHFQTTDGRLVILSKSDAYALYKELEALFNFSSNVAELESAAKWKSIMASEATADLNKQMFDEFLAGASDTEVDTSTEESTGTLREDDPDDHGFCDCFQCDPTEHNHI